MHSGEPTERTFRCPGCEESLQVDGPMEAMLIEKGCVVCGSTVTPEAFLTPT